MPISRRGVIVLPGALLFGAPQGPESRTPWYRKMRRCGQINFNQRDPQALDIKAWLDYWASLKLDALLLNAGGIVAFYPTKIPFHHKSEFLGDRDLFGDFSKGAKARGIRVIARLDCNYAWEEAWKLSVTGSGLRCPAAAFFDGRATASTVAAPRLTVVAGLLTGAADGTG